jgi:hypothetical protein
MGTNISEKPTADISIYQATERHIPDSRGRAHDGDCRKNLKSHLFLEDRTIYTFILEYHLLFAGFLLGFDPENRDSTVLQNVLGLLPDCKALHPRRHSTVIVTYERS